MYNTAASRPRTTSDFASSSLLGDYSIEVMPRTASKIESFQELLPPNTRIYLANIEGTPFNDMVKSARRLRREGFVVMPHITARSVRNEADLDRMLARYRYEADVTQALVLAGGINRPHGEFTHSMQLLESGLFERRGFLELHVAGHPEGNRDIDPDGSTRQVDAALLAKVAYARRSATSMKIVTQFAFDPRQVSLWTERIAELGVDLPVRIGVAGPARLQTLIKFALSCGVGASLQVLQKRGRDLSQLLRPFEPVDMIAGLESYLHRHPRSIIEGIHFFPLGGIKPCVEWARRNSEKQLTRSGARAQT